MTFKFTKPIEEYTKHVTPEILKRAFEEYEFEVELKKDEVKECVVCGIELEDMQDDFCSGGCVSLYYVKQ